MGLFSFLFDHDAPAAGGTQTVSAAGLAPGSMAQRQQGQSMDLQQAPQMQSQPGLLHQLWNYAKSPEGMLSIGTALKSFSGDDNALDEQAAIQKGWQKQRADQQATESRAKKNAAFKAAYQGGKFDPGVYAAGLGEADVDPSDIASLAKTFEPKTGVDGGTAYTIDPQTGAVQWGGQRPMSHAEQEQINREAEIARHNHEMERLGGINAGANDYRAHKAPAARAAASTGLPPGYVPR